MDKRQTAISKFLSYALRHNPAAIGIELDANGWVPIADLLAAASSHGRSISREDVDFVVEHNNKRRFAISDDGARIRASQGHSVEVDLGYEPSVPPETLFHGTAARFVESIRERGLVRGARQHVHLSDDVKTATAVGTRHGSPVVLVVRAGSMAEAGMVFYISANGVWLTDHVPPSFIDFDAETAE